MVLVDDLPEMRRLVELWLEGSHLRVVGQAATCPEAFPIIDRQRIEVVVMDMNMPGPDGVACTAELLARVPRLIVIGFSSSEDPGVERDMRAAGASAYFHKSQLQELVAYLKSDELLALVSERQGG